MFGEFSVTFGERSIDYRLNRSKKIWTLLEYLITFRDREISQNELIELLWPEDELDNPANTLKTLLHRVRALVEDLGLEDVRKIITYKRSTYAWTPSIPCEVDTEQFEKLIAASQSPVISSEERLSILLSAIELYKGDFLPKNASDSWVLPISTYYRGCFIKAVNDATKLLKDANRTAEIVDICQKAVVIDPYEENLHVTLISALIQTNQRRKALEHYDYVKELFFTKFGINLSPEMTALYKEIVKTSNSTELDLAVIKEELRESEVRDGCFFCEYEFFKNIYQLEARTASRTGQVAFIALITVADAYGAVPGQKVLNKAMEKLHEMVMLSLRRGDVFSRYSVSQYLMLLPTTTYENADMVLQRILRSFRKENPRSPAILRYTLQPLTPVEF